MADPTDIHVGSQVRARRRAIGLSQKVVAENLGISFQQLQKYEKGVNRISASRLQLIAQILDLKITDLFSGASVLPKPSAGSERVAAELAREIRMFNRAFLRIRQPLTRKSLFDLVETLSAPDESVLIVSAGKVNKRA